MLRGSLCRRFPAGRFHFGKHLRSTPILVQRRLGSERRHPLPERRYLFNGEHTEERLQYNGRFAKARIQIIVKNFQVRPLFPPGDGDALADFSRCLTSFSLQAGDDFFQSAELSKKTCAGSKSNQSQQIIRSRYLLGAFAPEEPGTQGAVLGNVPNCRLCSYRERKVPRNRPAMRSNSSANMRACSRAGESFPKWHKVKPSSSATLRIP